MGKKKGAGKRIVRLPLEDRQRISGGKGSDVRKHDEAVASQQTAMASGNYHLSAMMRLTQSGPRRVGGFSDRQRILIVGDGDFSFSLSLASAVGGANLLCTSLDKPSQLQVKYGQGVAATLNALKSMQAKLHHEVDAFKLHKDAFIKKHRFDRIVFNFPDLAPASPTGELEEPTIDFLSNFLLSASQQTTGEDSEIHVTVRSKEFVAIGKKISGAARAAGLECSKVSDFDASEFMGYKPQHTYPGSPSAKKGLLPGKRLVFTHATKGPGSKRGAAELEEESEEEAESVEEGVEDEDNEGADGDGKKKKKKKGGKRRNKRRGGKFGGDVLPEAPKVRETSAAAAARSAASFLFGR